MQYPKKILHWVNDTEIEGHSKDFFSKLNPANEQKLADVASGTQADVESAVESAVAAFDIWHSKPVVERANILQSAAKLLEEKKSELAEIISQECGKSLTDALGEINAAIECGRFIAEQTQSFAPEFIKSKNPGRTVFLTRNPVGVAALIVPFNNPAASLAWKIFPALFCGNTVVIKAHEDTPYVAVWFAKIFKEAGLPNGVISVVQGLGQEVGAALVADSRVDLISFTGSVQTGRLIIKNSADRLAKVSIEAGGKNPLVICDDADIDLAVATSIQSAFVDGGQRCAAASRIVIFESVYEQFKEKFLSAVKQLVVGVAPGANYGAIINERRLNQILGFVSRAREQGIKILAGGNRISGTGFFMEPTVLEGARLEDEISCFEVFGPVVNLYQVKDLTEAIRVSNATPFGLSGAIHTKDPDRVQKFVAGYHSGVVRVNGPTHGSEPHMPFGGVKLSGNGWREPGLKAFDFYTDWRQVSIDNQKYE
ncbi:MAG: aldehyde dehydrogenase [Candidatus Buchananbacteria bacterium]|nr:aldehyde dehydrogenase [Candidatus Buchananbacteria bacterium]